MTSSRHWATFIGLLALLVLAACGGSGGGGSNSNANGKISLKTLVITGDDVDGKYAKLIKEDGSSEQMLMNGATALGYVGRINNGDHIINADFGDVTQTNIYLVSSDGSVVTPLRDSTDIESVKYIKSDGRIVYTANDSLLTTVRIMNSDGTNDMVVAEPGGAFQTAVPIALLANGDLLVQENFFDGTHISNAIFRINPDDTANPITIDARGDASFMYLGESSDGRIVYQRDLWIYVIVNGNTFPQLAERQLVSTAADGSDLTVLDTTATDWTKAPRVLSNNRVLYGKRNTTGLDELYTATTDGSITSVVGSQAVANKLKEYRGITSDNQIVYTIQTLDLVNSIISYDLRIASSDASSDKNLSTYTMAFPDLTSFVDVTESNNIVYNDGINLFYFDLAKGTETKITNSDTISLFVAEFANNKVIYHEKPTPLNNDIYVADASSGSNQAIVANPDAHEYYLAHTPAGRVIYMMNDAGIVDIYSATYDGNNVTRLTTTTSETLADMF